LFDYNEEDLRQYLFFTKYATSFIMYFLIPTERDAVSGVLTTQYQQSYAPIRNATTPTQQPEKERIKIMLQRNIRILY